MVLDKSAGKREIWVDRVKIIACVLVALGHLLRGLFSAGIMTDSGFFGWFVDFIYYFHVPLFFLASGWLYQKFSVVDSLKSYSRNVLKKLIALGVPYFAFSIVSITLKKIFESSVNSKAGGYLHTLFLAPESPYWFLYILFFMFLITPTLKSKRGAFFLLGASILLNAAVQSAEIFSANIGYIPKWLGTNYIWFVIGMCAAKTDFVKRLSWKTAILGAAALPASIVAYVHGFSFAGLGVILGLFACLSVVSVCVSLEKQTKAGAAFAKYTMPIFLMHTIFAPGFRAILLRFGVTNAAVHLVCGAIVSIALPVIAGWIMNKTKILNIFMYPNSYLKANTDRKLKK